MATTTITITLSKNEILYEVRNKTYLAGNALLKDDNAKQVSDMQATTDEEVEAQLLRTMSNAWSKLRSRLWEWIDTVAEATGNAVENGGGDYVLELKVPTNFGHGATASIGSQAHEFIVNQCIGEWYLLVNPELSQQHYALAEASLMELLESMYRRRRGRRRTSDGETAQGLDGDLNQDGELTVADLNLLIEMIFGHASAGMSTGGKFSTPRPVDGAAVRASALAMVDTKYGKATAIEILRGKAGDPVSYGRLCLDIENAIYRSAGRLDKTDNAFSDVEKEKLNALENYNDQPLRQRMATVQEAVSELGDTMGHLSDRVGGIAEVVTEQRTSSWDGKMQKVVMSLEVSEPDYLTVFTDAGGNVLGHDAVRAVLNDVNNYVVIEYEGLFYTFMEGRREIDNWVFIMADGSYVAYIDFFWEDTVIVFGEQYDELLIDSDYCINGKPMSVGEINTIIYGKKSSTGFRRGELYAPRGWVYDQSDVTLSVQTIYFDVTTRKAYTWDGKDFQEFYSPDFSSFADVAFSGSYDDLDDTPSIPTKTSDLVNDSGFVSTAVVEVSDTGAVSQALAPNTFYKFTGALTSLALTLTAGTGLVLYAGKFTTSSSWGSNGLSVPSGVTEASGNDTIAAGKTYEFSILDNIIVVKEVA